MRKILQFAFLFAFAVAGHFTQAQTSVVQGFCSTGGVKVLTSGLPSSTTVQGSYPNCLVTVYNTGTITKATLFADGSGTPLANPFTANANASWLFYAANGVALDV